jgi:hypothetical protein
MKNRVKNEAAAIAAAELRTQRAEAAALRAEVRHAILANEVAKLEQAEAWRRHKRAEAAVDRMAILGKLSKHNLALCMEYHNLFTAHPDLIPLVAP